MEEEDAPAPIGRPRSDAVLPLLWSIFTLVAVILLLSLAHLPSDSPVLSTAKDSWYGDFRDLSRPVLILLSGVFVVSFMTALARSPLPPIIGAYLAAIGLLVLAFEEAVIAQWKWLALTPLLAYFVNRVLAWYRSSAKHEQQEKVMDDD